MVILYDPNCSLCTSLALFLRNKAGGGVSIEPSSSGELGAVLGDATLWGVDAWAAIVEHYPASRELQWLAVKLRLVRPLAATLHRTGKLVRRFCRACG